MAPDPIANPVDLLPSTGPSSVPWRRSDLQHHEFDGEAVLYSVAHHAMHYLNGTAYLIWCLCDGATTASELSDKVAEACGVTNDDALARDTAASLADLTADGLIDWRPVAA